MDSQEEMGVRERQSNNAERDRDSEEGRVIECGESLKQCKS